MSFTLTPIQKKLLRMCGSASEPEAVAAFKKLRESIGIENWSRFAEALAGAEPEQREQVDPLMPIREYFGTGARGSMAFTIRGGSIYVRKTR